MTGHDHPHVALGAPGGEDLTQGLVGPGIQAAQVGVKMHPPLGHRPEIQLDHAGPATAEFRLHIPETHRGDRRRHLEAAGPGGRMLHAQLVAGLQGVEEFQGGGPVQAQGSGLGAHVRQVPGPQVMAPVGRHQHQPRLSARGAGEVGIQPESQLVAGPLLEARHPVAGDLVAQFAGIRRAADRPEGLLQARAELHPRPGGRGGKQHEDRHKSGHRPCIGGRVRDFRRTCRAEAETQSNA